MEATSSRKRGINKATEEVERASKSAKAAMDKLQRTRECLNYHQQKLQKQEAALRECTKQHIEASQKLTYKTFE